MTLGAQTASPASDVKFAKVAAPVTNQSAQGTRPAGEFYHATFTGAAWGDYDNDGYLDLFYSDRNTLLSDNTVFSNLYHNNGQGGFSRTLRSPIASTAFSCPVWLDVNNDGNLDLVISGLSDWHYGWNDKGANVGKIKAHLYLGNGDGTFDEVEDSGLLPLFNGLTGGKGHNWVSAADYDHDGFTDLVMLGFDDINRLDKEHPENALRVVYLYRNINGERFELQPTPVDGDKPLHGLTDGSAVFADLDGDGWVDLFTTGYGASHNSEGYIYWNNGDGTFTQGEPLPVWALTNASCSVADLDNDGLLDLVLTGVYVDAERKCFYICKNNGDRTFSAVEVSNLEGIDGGQLAFGDVNHDGWIDILVGGHGQSHEHTTWLYLNQGNFTFDVYGAYYNDPFGKLGSFTRVTHGSHHLVDYDNDGYLDAWFTGWSAGSCANGCMTELWHNDCESKGITPNVAPSAPTALVATPGTEGRVALSWLPGGDEVTPVSALRYNLFVKKVGDSPQNLFMIIPADLSTGFLKVTAINHALSGCSYELKLPAGDYEWGVQTIDNGNLGSVFATGLFTVATSAVEHVVGESEPVVKAGVNRIEYRLKGAGLIRVYDTLGIRLSGGMVSGSGSLAVPASGVYIVVIEQNGRTYSKKLVL